MAEYKDLLSHLLQPKCVADFLLPHRLEMFLSGIVDNGRMGNFTFYGRPGVGKTSMARLITRDYDTLEINGSKKGSENLNTITTFSTGCSLVGMHKVCLIDEADSMTPSVLNELRYVIEFVSTNCRFILTANDDSKISDALISRCHPISFNLTRDEHNIIKQNAASFYEKRLADIGVEYGRNQILGIVGNYFPDYRAIANQINIEIGG